MFNFFNISLLEFRVSSSFNIPLFLALSNPVESNNDDDADYLQDKSDDGYDDYDDDADDKRKSSTEGPQKTEDQTYKTEERIEKADAGKEVTLKCSGDGFDSDTLYMWYNDTALLKQGNSQVSHSPRLTFKDNVMIINDVSPFDDGVFRCRAFTKQERFETKIQLHVNGPPQGIAIGHNINSQSSIAGETLNYRSGEKNLRFKCNAAKGRPQPKIDWIHNGNTILESQMKDHDIKIEDEGLLIIKTLHPRHAGEYQCEASNEFGNLKALFKIEVECKLKNLLTHFGINDVRLRSSALHASSCLLQHGRRK